MTLGMKFTFVVKLQQWQVKEKTKYVLAKLKHFKSPKQIQVEEHKVYI